MSSRREFVRQLGAGMGGVAMAAAFPGRSAPLTAAGGGDAAEAPRGVRIGYAAITWGGDDDHAIDDIAALGFRGIQLRANVVERYRGRPEALRTLLAEHRLRFVALSSGNVSPEPAVAQRMIDLHVDHARFLRDAGGLYLQLIDERPQGRTVERDDYQRLGHVMSEIGRRASELGIAVGYHPHMGSMGETPEGSARALAASDARYVKLLLDVAHYQAGGGDPVAAIHRYARRLLFLHVKDVRTTAGSGYQFVELGRGEVKLPAVFAALRAVRFAGWGIVELDSVPPGDGTPKDAAAVSRKYLEETIGVRI